jgi:hypothetical protein
MEEDVQIVMFVSVARLAGLAARKCRSALRAALHGASLSVCNALKRFSPNFCDERFNYVLCYFSCSVDDCA